MDKDEQLLATARDCFHFVTRFFEVIKLSAPHIYHSALELSPKSSIIQKHYHHQHIIMISWYWHFVDAVWVIVFTVVYVIGAKS